MKDSIDNAGSKLYKGKKSLNEIISGAGKMQKLQSEPKAALFKRSSTIMPSSKSKSSNIDAKSPTAHNYSNINPNKIKELELDAEIESAINQLED